PLSCLLLSTPSSHSFLSGCGIRAGWSSRTAQVLSPARLAVSHVADMLMRILLNAAIIKKYFPEVPFSALSCTAPDPWQASRARWLAALPRPPVVVALVAASLLVYASAGAWCSS